MSELKQTIRYCKAPDGRAIAWSTMGSGPPVVVVGGVGHLEGDFRCPPYARYWGDLARRCTLIRYDGRGIGLSDRAFQEITLEGLIEDVQAAVDAARLERFSIFALASGAPQAIELAARFQHRVDKLVLYGGFAKGFLRRTPTPEQVALREVLYAALERGWRDRTFRTLNTRLGHPTASPDEVEAIGELYETALDGRQCVALIKWQAQADLSEAATRIACPTLVVHARNDARIPFDEGRRLASLIPNAQLVPIDSHGNHAMPSEPAYAEAMARVLDFLASGQAEISAPSRLPHLTPREHQVLELIAQGKDNLQIAAHLSLSEKTVRNHITPIFDKLQVENRAQAIVKAREAGLGQAGSTGKP